MNMRSSQGISVLILLFPVYIQNLRSDDGTECTESEGWRGTLIHWCWTFLSLIKVSSFIKSLSRFWKKHKSRTEHFSIRPQVFKAGRKYCFDLCVCVCLCVVCDLGRCVAFQGPLVSRGWAVNLAVSPGLLGAHKLEGNYGKQLDARFLQSCEICGCCLKGFLPSCPSKRNCPASPALISTPASRQASIVPSCLWQIHDTNGVKYCS